MVTLVVDMAEVGDVILLLHKSLDSSCVLRYIYILSPLYSSICCVFPVLPAVAGYKAGRARFTYPVQSGTSGNTWTYPYDGGYVTESCRLSVWSCCRGAWQS